MGYYKDISEAVIEDVYPFADLIARFYKWAKTVSDRNDKPYLKLFEMHGDLPMKLKAK